MPMPVLATAGCLPSTKPDSASTGMLLSRVQALPTLPKVVQSLIESFSATEIDLVRIAKLIQTDPVITAKVLRLANSAYYNRTRKVASINDAVVFLGIDALRMLVVGAGFSASVKIPPALGRAAFWRYCTHTAAVAKWLADRAGAMGPTAFTVGLLHAIGEPLMQLSLGEVMAPINAELAFYEAERPDLERARLGFSYSDLGAELAQHWRFPEEIADAIRQAPSPLESASPSRLALCVHLGAQFAAAHERGEAREAVLAALDIRITDALGLSLDALAAMPDVTELAAGLEAMTQ